MSIYNELEKTVEYNKLLTYVDIQKTFYPVESANLYDFITEK